jgi:hypothetical protein
MKIEYPKSCLYSICFVLVLVFHHTDTSLYLLSLALALSIHNKLPCSAAVFVANRQPKYIGYICFRLMIHNKQPIVHRLPSARGVNLLVYSLSLHWHSYIGFILVFASSIHNKQQLLGGGRCHYLRWFPSSPSIVTVETDEVCNKQRSISHW